MFPDSSQLPTKKPTESASKTVRSWLMWSVAVQLKAGDLVALGAVLVGEDTRDNNRSGQGLVLPLVLASRVEDFEEDLAVEAEDSEAASAATEVAVSVIEEVLVREVVSAITAVVELEAVVGMRMVLLRPMRPVGQAVVAAATVVNLMDHWHLIRLIVAGMVTVTAMGTVEGTWGQLQDMTAATREA